ncbi:STAS/SEC14 domain-containing protein [Sabulibacter ruber]|uniref:STAS/SEC14 domain-containing protein n=1 Tax=Sabulibacter ruber TaxID=2811901 RepID=UPI001A962F9E|nr:STAS/SEC14 domain-containing protein [Sabulibacter ruber]
MEYYKSDIITITYEEDLQLVRTKWYGFAGSQEYREILGIYLQLAKEHTVTRWIGDNTNARAIRPADQEWTAKEWAPRFSQESGLRKMAVIVATDIFNKMAVENMVMKGSGLIKFDTHFFDNEADAFAWVMED